MEYKELPLYLTIFLLEVLILALVLHQSDEIDKFEAAIGDELQEFKVVIEDFTYITERLEMKNPEIMPKVKLDGIYFNKRGYYCVWTKGYEEEYIENVEYHEACHMMIREDYYHFCEEYY